MGDLKGIGRQEAEQVDIGYGCQSVDDYNLPYTELFLNARIYDHGHGYNGRWKC